MTTKQKVIAKAEELRVDVFMIRDDHSGARVELYAPKGYVFLSNDSHCVVECGWYSTDSWRGAYEHLSFGIEVCQQDDCDNCTDDFTDEDIKNAVYYAPRMWA